MTTNSDAYFARFLAKSFAEKHPEFPVEAVKGRRIGVGSVRVIQITFGGGKFAQFPFPPKGLHAGAVHDALYASACSMLRLTPHVEVESERAAT